MVVLLKKMKKNHVAVFLSVLLMCQTFQNVSANNEKKNVGFAKKGLNNLSNFGVGSLQAITQCFQYFKDEIFSCEEKTDISVMEAVRKYLKEKILADKKNSAIAAGVVLSIPLLIFIANAAKNMVHSKDKYMKRQGNRENLSSMISKKDKKIKSGEDDKKEKEKEDKDEEEKGKEEKGKEEKDKSYRFQPSESVTDVLPYKPSPVKEQTLSKFEKKFTDEEKTEINNIFNDISKKDKSSLEKRFQGITRSDLVILRFIFIARKVEKNKSICGYKRELKNEDICNFIINIEDPKFYINCDLLKFLQLHDITITAEDGIEHKLGSKDESFKKEMTKTIFKNIMICQRLMSFEDHNKEKSPAISESDMNDLCDLEKISLNLEKKDLIRIIYGSAAMCQTLLNREAVFYKVMNAAMEGSYFLTFGFDLKSFKIVEICRLFRQILLEKNVDQIKTLKDEIEEEINKIKKIETPVAVFVRLKNAILEGWDQIKVLLKLDESSKEAVSEGKEENFVISELIDNTVE